MLKPRIRRRYGIWYCFTVGVMSRATLPMGQGYSPLHAYADWWAQMRKTWVES
jgi:hypothetical protein